LKGFILSPSCSPPFDTPFNFEDSGEFIKGVPPTVSTYRHFHKRGDNLSEKAYYKWGKKIKKRNVFFIGRILRGGLKKRREKKKIRGKEKEKTNRDNCGKKEGRGRKRGVGRREK
jgi:hypothetical protein